MALIWNPWHGCRKISTGCRNCYVYRSDAKYGRDASIVNKTGDFSLALRKKRDGEYKLAPGERAYTCFTSDFFLEEADAWRGDIWEMIRVRSDASFFIITKRIHRFPVELPEEWGEGYDNVTLCCTCENQDRANYRLPLFLEARIRHRCIVCEPLLGPIELAPFLGSGIEKVIVGGESGEEARPCHFDWILDIRRQCAEAGVAFHFKQTGARFVKDGRLYRIARRLQHSQAVKAGIDIPL